MNKIIALYNENSPRTFSEDLQAHLVNGFVFSTPEMFLMFRPVRSTADPAEINDPRHHFKRSECDSWYIYAYATARKTSPQSLVKKLLRYQPYALPLVAWEKARDQRLRFHSIKKLATL